MGLLRLLLALAVVIAHSKVIYGWQWTKLTGGLIAVQTFYVISGFYMTLILNTKFTQSKQYLSFIESRLFRLLPTYLLAALITIIAGVLLRSYGFAGLRPINAYMNGTIGIGEILIGFSNLVLFGQDIVMFLGVDPQSHALYFTKAFMREPIPAYIYLIVPQAWTLGLELCFYVIAPFIVRSHPWKIMRFLALFLIFRFCLYKLGFSTDPWDYRFFPAELPLFLMGSLAYHAYTRLPATLFKPILGYCAVTFMLTWTVLYYPMHITHRFIGIPLYTFALVALLPWIFHTTRNNVWDRRVGELSYPVYIFHWFIMGTIYQLGIVEIGLIGSIITIILSIITHITIVMPIDKWRRKKFELIKT